MLRERESHARVSGLGRVEMCGLVIGISIETVCSDFHPRHATMTESVTPVSQWTASVKKMTKPERSPWNRSRTENSAHSFLDP